MSEIEDVRESVRDAIFEALCDSDDMSEMGRADAVADVVLAIPRIVEALEALEREESYSPDPERG
jgi:hypothetical protein